MPRKMYVTNWLAQVETTPEKLEKFKSDYPPSQHLNQLDEQPISKVAIEHPISMQIGEIGAASFVPSPLPGASNVMYQDKVVWSAVLEDGTIFAQYAEDGKERSSEDIPRNGLRKFCLLAKEDNRVLLVQEYQPGWKFFYRRRTAMDQGGPIEVVHIIGTKYQLGSDWLTQMVFLYEDDLSIVSGDVVMGKPEPILGKLFKWRHPVIFVDADEEIIS